MRFKTFLDFVINRASKSLDTGSRFKIQVPSGHAMHHNFTSTFGGSTVIRKLQSFCCKYIYQVNIAAG